MNINRAIEIAELWRAGKLLGGDPYEACDRLLLEIECLQKIS